MEQSGQYSEMNRVAWNEVAHVRQRALFPPAGFFADGGSILDPEPVAALGDVQGKRLLHLQCATGEDTLSWVNLGAHVTGVDIADQQIELARHKADEAGVAARFVAADVLRLPPELQQADFDVVYTGGGVLCWLPELEPWARGIAAALRPGGRFLVWDDHPLAGCLEMAGERLVVVGDYFRRGRADICPGWRHFAGGEGAACPKAEFNWPLGDIVTALAGAGLYTERLREEPAEQDYRFTSDTEELKRLPGRFLLLARKRDR